MDFADISLPSTVGRREDAGCWREATLAERCWVWLTAQSRRPTALGFAVAWEAAGFCAAQPTCAAYMDAGALSVGDLHPYLLLRGVRAWSAAVSVTPRSTAHAPVSMTDY
jgi:hypothetical protein